SGCLCCHTSAGGYTRYLGQRGLCRLLFYSCCHPLRTLAWHACTPQARRALCYGSVHAHQPLSPPLWWLYCPPWPGLARRGRHRFALFPGAAGCRADTWKRNERCRLYADLLWQLRGNLSRNRYRKVNFTDLEWGPVEGLYLSWACLL